MSWFGKGIFLCLCAVLQLACSQMSKAYIDIAGYKGIITFSSSGLDTNVSVLFNSGAATSNYTSLYLSNIPAIFGQLQSAQKVCGGLEKSSRFIADFTNSSTINVNGLSGNDVFSRGIVMKGSANDPILCATIEPEGDDVTTYRSKFIGAVVGEVWIRKRNSWPGLFIYADLAYANARENPSDTTNMTLKGYDNGSVKDADFSTRCDSLSSPNSFSLNLPVGNSASSPGKKTGNFMPDVSIPGSNLGVGILAQTLACAHVYTVTSKTVIANIFWDDVNGTITMSQASPFTFTTTAVFISGVRSVPAGYHVHKYPVPQRLSKTEQRCSGDNVGGHFNPYGVIVGNSPSSGTGSSDEYELGDLSGKYGAFASDSISAEYTDWNLPLFGPNSIVGRSIVIHMSDGSRWVCATIEYPSAVTSVVVRFKSPAYGSMYLRQTTNDFDSDTSVFIELANMNGVASFSHNYHIHVYPVAADCASAGPHYDPSGAMSSNNYSAICSVENPLQCELGDLSRRHSGIDIGTMLRQNKKFFITDSNLPLSGPFSVVGRSIVVHNPNSAAPRFACANITQLRPTMVKTTSEVWQGDDSDGTVTGHLTFIQDSEYDRTAVQSTVSGLSNLASQYHVHVFPVPENAEGSAKCSPASVEGHYNPFAISTILPALSNTYDKYEVGDLSNKYGLVDGSTSIELNGIRDNNLPLFTGSMSSSGRSIVIHRPDSSRWKCNSLQMQPSDQSGHAIEADVKFNTLFIGYVKLRQIVYEDGSASLTSIELSLSNSNGITSLNHNWHVHIDPITTQDECGTAKGHFDPYQAVATALNYSYQCNPSNPLACEVGDLSNKHTQHDLDGLRKLYLDEDLPLHTDKTVLGRSIVFHEQEGGADRLGCANILPTSNTFTLAFDANVNYDHYHFTSAVAKAVKINRLRVVVLHNTDIPVIGKGCAQVMVHLAGVVPQNDIDALLAGTQSDLSPYNPTANCQSETGANVIGKKSGASGMEITLVRVTAFAFLTVLFYIY